MDKEGKEPQQPAGGGPFEFFRKYQKVILYTAGLFALVSFSITGALLGFFDDVFRDTVSYGTIEVGGRVVPLTQGDYDVARLLNRGGAYPTVVLPNVGLNDDSGGLQLFAMLRRVAIELGLEVSQAEVDRAINQVVQQSRAQGTPLTPTQIAINGRYTSLEAFRRVVAEAMRIGNYLRMEALGADTSDAAMTKDMLDRQKRIVLKVAKLDKAGMQESLEEAGVSDEELQTWLEGLDDIESARFRDTNHVSLLLAAVVYDQFDREEFLVELEDVEIGEQQMRQNYDRDKELRWRRDQGLPPLFRANYVERLPPPPQDPYLPFEDVAVQSEIRRNLEAEAVLRGLWRQVQAARTEHLKEPQAARDEAIAERTTADQALQAAEVDLALDPNSAEMKEKRDQAAAKLEAEETEYEEAETAMEAARASFDMAEAFTEAVNGRPGFEVVPVPGPKNADGLGELPVLGTWTDSWAATSISSVGDLSSLLQWAKHGAFFFMVTELVERPLRPFSEIAEEARTEYFTTVSDEEATEKGEAFDAALLRLGRQQIADRVAELEAEKEAKLEERLTRWKDETTEELEKAKQGLLDNPNQRLRVHQAFKARRDQLQAELEREEERRQEFQEELDRETDEQIASEAREVYRDVFDAAAEEAGFEVTTLPPYSRQLASDDPRFEYRYSEDVKFLFRNPSAQNLEEGEMTELLDDATGRTLYMALCESVDDITLDDITRRQLLQARTGFGFGFPEARLQDTFLQSFTLEALETRFKWKPAEDEVR